MGNMKTKLERKSSISKTSSNFLSVLPYTLRLGLDDHAFKRLKIISGTDVDSTDSSGTTALHIASETGNLSLLTLLLHKKADINLRDRCNSTPLHLASGNGHIDCALQLLQAKAYCDARDVWGWTPLHRAVINHHYTLAGHLIESGCCVNMDDETKRVPLHVAASYGQQNLTKRLIKAGANLNWQDARGRTPLYLAIVGNQTETVRDLIDAGCNINLANNGNISPLALAATKGYDAIVEILLHNGAAINNQMFDETEKSPLSSVLLRALNMENVKFLNYMAVARKLIKVGGDPPSSKCFFLIYRMLKQELHPEAIMVGQMLFAAGMTVALEMPGKECPEDRIVGSWLAYYNTRSCYSLLELCRLRIRSYLQSRHGNIQQAVHELGLPTSLRDYVLLLVI